jgi:pimeloyl-ACP methyl ester carboxylesterase
MPFMPFQILGIWIRGLLSLAGGRPAVLAGHSIGGMILLTFCRLFLAGPGTPAQEDFLSRLMLKARPDVLARGMFGMMAFDESATLSSIGVPTLVVIGDRDVTTVPGAGEFIARYVPGSLPVTLSPARHLGLFEYHGQFDQILADFADSSLVAAPSTVITT